MKILIANRGEIAIRIMRACREMGLASVAVYSDCDREAPHVRYADEAHPLGPSEPARSYLNAETLLAVARRSGATAVHPGYGFLAENAGFARAVADAGLTFIGPTAEAIALMGSKVAARQAATRAGVPVVPGTENPLGAETSDDDIVAIAESIGYPLLVKAVAGGGGKGMRTVASRADLAAAIETARSEAGSAFGDTAVYLERKLEQPRHVEIQLLGDHHGTVVPFVERECSIQRRHQKVIEEAPSIAVTPELRRAMADCAAAVARGVGYTNAGTIEFLLDASGTFYFLEMNTRLQVEHPITEAVTGFDLAQWQIRIARGERLDIDPVRALTPRGHAIECRVYAEDPDTGFMPSPGLITTLETPSGPGVRDDSGVAAGFTVPVYYDSLMSKLVVWGEDRPQALARLARALSEYRVLGVKTTIPFFQWIIRQPDFQEGRFDTTYLDRLLADPARARFADVGEAAEELAAIAVALETYLRASAADGGPRPRAGAWRQAARVEGLRPA